MNTVRSRRQVVARERRRLAGGAPDEPEVGYGPIQATSWRTSIQNFGSGDVVHLDLVPADALGLGRRGQWTVVVNESHLFSPAMGLDRFWRLCRRAMVLKIEAEAVLPRMNI